MTCKAPVSLTSSSLSAMVWTRTPRKASTSSIGQAARESRERFVRTLMATSWSAGSLRKPHQGRSLISLVFGQAVVRAFRRGERERDVKRQVFSQQLTYSILVLVYNCMVLYNAPWIKGLELSLSLRTIARGENNTETCTNKRQTNSC